MRATPGSAKNTFIGLTGNAILADAIQNAMEDRRARLNELVQALDQELGNADPRVIAAVDRFINGMWEQF